MPSGTRLTNFFFKKADTKCSHKPERISIKALEKPQSEKVWLRVAPKLKRLRVKQGGLKHFLQLISLG